MDSFEWNKIAGWVLTAAIAALGLSMATGFLFPKTLPETPAYVVEGVEVEGEAGGAEGSKPIAFFLANADVAKGEAQFKKCAACHTIDKGGAQGIGPNLYGIVNAKFAHVAGFGYSDAVRAAGDRTWDWESLSAWVENPRKYLPGNKMSFAGLGKPEDRANLLAYLNTRSDSPQPLPAVPAEEPAAAPADEAAQEAPAETVAPSGSAPQAGPAPAAGAKTIAPGDEPAAAAAGGGQGPANQAAPVLRDN